MRLTDRLGDRVCCIVPLCNTEWQLNTKEEVEAWLEDSEKACPRGRRHEFIPWLVH